jgi:hypothetical protein
MLQSPWFFSSKNPVEDSGVYHPSVESKVIMERWSDVPHRIQLLPDPGLFKSFLIFRNIET